MVNGMVDGRAHFAQQSLHQRQVAQQAGAAVALDHFIDRAAEVDIENVEAEILADARGVGHDGGVGAEELRGDGMLVRVEAQIFGQRLGGFAGAQGGADAVRAGELGHDQPAAARLRMKRRNTVSVTPAMGASTVAGAIRTGPIENWWESVAWDSGYLILTGLPETESPRPSV